MEEKIYSICISVPLGKRNGLMHMQKNGNSISGWLDLMNHRNTFTGKFSDQKKLEISGVLKTLIGTVSYTATGIVTSHTVYLELTSDSNDHYFIYGEEKCNS